MANYYTTNAIYEELSKIQHNFLWASGNSWTLIYGNKIDIEPKIIAFVQGYSWPYNQLLIDAVANISDLVKIPILYIKFDDTAKSVQTVDIWDARSQKYNSIPLNELKKIFHLNGLNIADGSCDKYLNSEKSSAYHAWQRESLGNKIVVSDLDLIRIDPQNKIVIEICELKRSFYSLSEWKPYSDDYINFNLLYNMIKNSTIAFKIVYNQRTKNPWRDIHDPVKVYSYTSNKPVLIQEECSFSDFVKGC